MEPPYSVRVRNDSFSNRLDEILLGLLFLSSNRDFGPLKGDREQVSKEQCSLGRTAPKLFQQPVVDYRLLLERNAIVGITCDDGNIPASSVRAVNDPFPIDCIAVRGVAILARGLTESKSLAG